ncbi:MAG: hypothetical protein LBQ50_03455, partial [Planctomycetaceae bacterium]|nr:hypothetical protein [Planctomycetaceae bacterium]
LAHNQINAALEEKIKETDNLLQQYALEEETLENEIQKLQTTKQSLEQNIASTQKNIVQIQKDVTQIQKNMAQIQENIDDLSQKVAQKEKKLNDKNDNDKNSRSEKLRMPKLHFSKNNLTLNLMMRYNRLYDVSDRYDFDYFGDEVGKPKPNRGIIVDKTDASKKMVQELLRSYSSNNHYVTIFVYGDSADQFYLVRDCIVTAGFEYALIPITDDEVWTFGGSGDTRPVQ